MAEIVSQGQPGIALCDRQISLTGVVGAAKKIQCRAGILTWEVCHRVVRSDFGNTKVWAARFPGSPRPLPLQSEKLLPMDIK